MGRAPMPQHDAGERELPPQGPPWRAGGPATLRVLILALLWRGSLSQLPGFTLTVPQSVSVQEGLCVLVPCTFTYPASYDTDNPSAQLYGYWYKEPATVGQDPPVANSATSLGVSQETQGRFRLRGDPAHGDCSLQISDARRTDTGRYFFSFEKGLLEHTYRSNSDGTDPALTISVPGLTEEPEIQISPARGLPGTLLAGEPVTVTCTAPGRCSGPPPRVTWTGPFSDTARDVSAQLANGTWAHSSALSFTPGPGDHGKELVCSVTYRPPQGPSTRRTVRLHVGCSLSQPPGFTLTVPQSVSVQEGLCVLVPCIFTYPASYDTDNPSAQLYGKWYKEPATMGQDPPVASSVSSLSLSQETRGRFRLTGDPAHGDCSLQISDARRTDAGKYFFSFEKGLLEHTYRSNSDGTDPALVISVRGLTEEPEIQISPARGLPGTLLAGEPVTVTCTAPGRCSGPPPRVTWTGPFSDTSRNVSAQLANGTWAHSSALSFTPGPGDHGKELICSVTYRPPRGPSTNRTVRLHVGWSLSQPPGFTLTVPQQVSVQEGLCIVVPCTFTYPASYDTDNPSAQLYGNWYKEPATVGQDPPVASSVSSLRVSQEIQGRFRLVGDPAHSDCSLQISDARRTDAGKYFFSIEKGLLEHTYRSNSFGTDPALVISVPELTEEPEIQISPARGLPGTLLAGKPVTVTCTAPGRCSGPPPRVTWMGPFSDTAWNISAQLANGTWAHSSALSFTPGLGDHGKELVCSVTYRPPQGPSTHRTVRLHVGYPPWPPNITGTLTRNGRPDSPRPGTGLNSSCQHQGPSVSCSCSLRSHPPPQLQWQVDGEPLAGNGSRGGPAGQLLGPGGRGRQHPELDGER
ncbi:sialic acid-binding Ig-like lectin 11 isoform X1 [Mauremys mutica]|uniref:sialic acid-binding Ig-like lectin 11 isoform X1 n=2 Tax=Mauremys mutica TaxID=74926 RepID=UPI001D15E9DE|nr:sialic acid-binding Ig-like lectin 11 isoform X1 [Mauremys mutica]